MSSPSFDPLIALLRQQSQVRREARRLNRRRNGLYRLFAEREYELTYDRGQILDHRLTGFGFETPARGSFFVRCARADRPPEGQEIIAAIARITARQFRPVEKPRYHLLGYLDEGGSVHPARRSWRGLHGRFALPALLILALMIASLWLLADAPPAHIVDPAWSFRMVLFFLINIFLVGLLFTKFSQRHRARRRFARHVDELDMLTQQLH